MKRRTTAPFFCSTNAWSFLRYGRQRVNSMFICSHAVQRERQLSANFCRHGAQERLLAHQQRRTFRPTGRNSREHQRLYKTGARRGPTVSDQIGFDQARRRILLAGGRPYRDSVALRSPPGGAAGVHLPLGSCPAPYRSWTRSPPVASHGFQERGPCDRCVPSTRSGLAAGFSLLPQIRSDASQSTTSAFRSASS